MRQLREVAFNDIDRLVFEGGGEDHEH
jgi:hypothetical protein